MQTDLQSTFCTSGLSAHAHRRLQQRAVPAMIVDLLEQFGSVVRCCGADRMIFDKAALKRLKRQLGGERGLRVLQPWLNVYAVVGRNGEIATVAHKTKRIRR